MTRQRNIANDAARLARAAQSDLASLQRAMKAARDAATGLQGAIKSPIIKTPRHTIKSTTSNPLAFLSGFSLSSSSESGSSGSGNLSSSPSGIGYQSPSQAAGNLSLSLKLGQRNL